MEDFQMEKPKSSKKWLWIVLGIIVILILIAAYVFAKNGSPEAPDQPDALTAVIESSPSATLVSASPAASPTTSQNSWKTYTSKTYGFSFSYPNDWSIIGDSAGEDSSVGKKLEITGTGKEDFQLWVNPDGFGFESASDVYQAEILNGKISIIEHNENTPSEAFPELDGQAVIGTMTSSNINYTIAYNFDIADRAAEIAKFEQIIKTFNFTK